MTVAMETVTKLRDLGARRVRVAVGDVVLEVDGLAAPSAPEPRVVVPPEHAARLAAEAAEREFNRVNFGEE